MSKHLKKFNTNVLSKKYLINLEEIKATLREFKTNSYIYIIVYKLTEIEFNHLFEFLDSQYWISLPQQSPITYGFQLRVQDNTVNTSYNTVGQEELFEIFKSHGCIEHV